MAGGNGLTVVRIRMEIPAPSLVSCTTNLRRIHEPLTAGCSTQKRSAPGKGPTARHVGRRREKKQALDGCTSEEGAPPAGADSPRGPVPASLSPQACPRKPVPASLSPQACPRKLVPASLSPQERLSRRGGRAALAEAVIRDRTRRPRFRHRRRRPSRSIPRSRRR